MTDSRCISITKQASKMFSFQLGNIVYCDIYRNLSKNTVDILKLIYRALKIKGYHRMRKAELLRHLFIGETKLYFIKQL